MKLLKLDQKHFSFLVDQIAEFRQTFELTINAPGEQGYLSTNVELHDALHLEEFKELAYAPNDVERIDALGDMMYVIVGRLVEAGVRCLEDAQAHFPQSIDWINYLVTLGADILGDDCAMYHVFKLIHESNMTKTCTYAQIVENQAHYQKEDIVLDVEHKGLNCYILKTRFDYPDKKLKKGKVIKNIHYSPVDLSVMFEQPCIEK